LLLAIAICGSTESSVKVVADKRLLGEVIQTNGGLIFSQASSIAIGDIDIDETEVVEEAQVSILPDSGDSKVFDSSINFNSESQGFTIEFFDLTFTAKGKGSDSGDEIEITGTINSAKASVSFGVEKQDDRFILPDVKIEDVSIEIEEGSL